MEPEACGRDLLYPLSCGPYQWASGISPDHGKRGAHGTGTSRRPQGSGTRSGRTAHDRAGLQDYNAAHSIDDTVKVNGRRQTNLGVFRAYLTAYLRSLPYTNQELHCMVRHLQPTDRGIPVELYFFSTVKDWIPYEEIQADVFDHVLAVIPEFDLRVFQSPSGADVQRMAWQEKN